jgi:transcriptional regulator with XRE-family HTH domain
MNTVAERIKYVRKSLNLTQQKFAERIGTKQNTIAQYEIGRNIPIDPVITAICKEFNVNEIWLRTGDGDPFQKVTIEEELGQILGNVLSGDPSSRSRLIRAFSRLPEDAYPWIEKIIVDMARELKAKEEAE